jgi:hypothetical protein
VDAMVAENPFVSHIILSSFIFQNVNKPKKSDKQLTVFHCLHLDHFSIAEENTGLHLFLVSHIEYVEKHIQ